MQNRVFPYFSGSARSESFTDAVSGRFGAPSRIRSLQQFPWEQVRWGKVQAIRSALARGAYNLEARIADLLDDPPNELF